MTTTPFASIPESSGPERQCFRAAWYAGQLIRRAGVQGVETWRELITQSLMLLSAELNDEDRRREIRGLRDALNELLELSDDIDRA